MIRPPQSPAAPSGTRVANMRQFLNDLHASHVRARAIAAYREYLASEGMVMLSVDTLPAFRFNAPTLDRPDAMALIRFRDTAGECEDGPLCLACGGDLMTLDARGLCGGCRS